MSFQVPEQVVDRLFRDTHTIRELTGTYPLQAGIAPERDMRCAQFVESCRSDSRIQLNSDPPPHDTEHGPDVRGPLALRAGGNCLT